VPEAGEVRRPQALLPLPVEHLDVVELVRQPVGDVAGSVRRVVVDDEDLHAVLAERTDAMHVFVYAPRDALIRRVMERQPGLRTRADAERLVDETNHQREQYVRRHWNRAWRDVENYDLCVNTDWLGVNGAADVVVDVASRKFRGE